MIVGYARVSTLEQNERLQTDALTKAGCERLFTDHASGAKAHRPELDHMLDTIREGDTLVVWKLDRFGRSVRDLVDLMMQSRGVGFRSLTEDMGTTTPGPGGTGAADRKAVRPHPCVPGFDPVVRRHMEPAGANRSRPCSRKDQEPISNTPYDL
jgi:hypothetical protein